MEVPTLALTAIESVHKAADHAADCIRSDFKKIGQRVPAELKDMVNDLHIIISEISAYLMEDSDDDDEGSYSEDEEEEEEEE